MSFTEIRFPENISYGSTGGPEFSTDVVTTHNGCEQRNINWSRARARYNIAYGVRSNEQLTELITFFQARKGKAIGFRFKDWSDFTVTNQEIGIGDNKKMIFQLMKTYISGKDKHTRMIKKPVHDTIKIYLDGVETEKYSVNYSTGEIEFMKPLGFVDKILEKPYKSSNKIEKTHKNLSSLVKSRKNAPKVLDFSKEAFNQMTFFVDMLIVIPLYFSIPFWWNNYYTSLAFKTCNKSITIVAFISHYSRVIDIFG